MIIYGEKRTVAPAMPNGHPFKSFVSVPIPPGLGGRGLHILVI